MISPAFSDFLTIPYFTSFSLIQEGFPSRPVTWDKILVSKGPFRGDQASEVLPEISRTLGSSIIDLLEGGRGD